MTTSAEIATRAIRRLGIVRPDETPSGEDQATAESVLAEIVAELVGDGLIYPEAAYPLDSRFQSSFVALLALRLTDEFGVAPTARLEVDAREGKARIAAAYFVPPVSRFDAALVTAPINGVRMVEIYDGTERSASAMWQPSTGYSIGAEVQSGDRIYRALVSGTSGSTAPTGAGSDIVDGTVTWAFIRMAA